MNYQGKSHWNNRAKKSFQYKKERFYTITAVPYYYSRRKLVLEMLKKIIRKNKVRSICDYGCGDGEYMIKLYNDICGGGNGIVTWKGYDISDEMIKKARETCKGYKDIEFGIAEKGLADGNSYDLIYSMAVLAHIKDNVCSEILCNFAEHMSEDGKIILCEQVGKTSQEGETYIRRTVDEYIDMVQSAGLCVERQYLIDFWAHRIFFERRIAKKIYEHMKADNDFDRRIEANTHSGFRMLSAFFTFISKPHIFRKRKGWGYVFLVIKK